MAGNRSLSEYYARRALEYESIYSKPERQEDLASLRSLLQNLLREQDVLELACGTGYWTEIISQTARWVTATDINDEVLEVAQTKKFPGNKVLIRKADAFTLDDISGLFTAGFAAFWWSHMAKSQIPGFLRAFHSKLGRDRLVVFTDNNYVEGSSSPVLREDEEGNTYQKRRLKDGSEYEVLKNFPSANELRGYLKGRAEAVEVRNLTYYWCLSYRTRPAP